MNNVFQQTGIIYKAINIINNKIYIGQTIYKLKYRINRHYRSAKNNSTLRFHQAIKKYGEHNFNWEILCNNIPILFLDYYETLYIIQYNSYNNGYNSTLGGDENPMFSAAARYKNSLSQKKNKNKRFFTEDHKIKLSESNKEYWSNHPEQAKQRSKKRSDSGYKIPDCVRKQIGETLKKKYKKMRENNIFLANQKLTKDQILYIRNLYILDKLNSNQLADKFNVSASYIRGIANGNQRKDIVEFLDDIKTKVKKFNNKYKFLTKNDILEIRNLSILGYSNKTIALKFNTTIKQIWRIITKERWKNV